MHDLTAGTLMQALERSATSWHQPGLRFLDRHEQATEFTYAAVLKRAQTVATALRAMGVQAGDHIALILPTSIAFSDAFFGAQQLGAVPVPLYPPQRLGRMDEYHERTARMLQVSHARLVITSPSIRRLIGPAIAAARPPLGCFTLEQLLTHGEKLGAAGDAASASGIAAEPAGSSTTQGMGASQPASPSAPIVPPVNPDAPALLQFSSGTTVDPKPVSLTHRQVLANIAAIVGQYTTAYPESDQFHHSGVSWLPLYHDMGLIGCLLSAMVQGRTMTLIPPELFIANPAIWLRAISRYRASVATAPNFGYALCADRIRDEALEDIDLSSWRVALNGAEPVSANTLERFIKRFTPYGFRREALTPVYGLAEAALAVTFGALKQPFRVSYFDPVALHEQGQAVPALRGSPLVSVGQPLPGVRLRISASDGSELPEGRLGEIHVRGPSLMQGYFGQEAATQSAVREGWLRTGDLGFMLGGALYMYGRSKDVIIIRGRNYAPHDIEHAVDTVAGVRTGCCVAVSHRADGDDTERLLIFVERAKKVSVEDPGAMDKSIKEQVVAATGLMPSRVFVLAPGTLPRTSSGKLRRRETLHQFMGGRLRPPAKVTPIKVAAQMVRSQWTMPRNPNVLH